MTENCACTNAAQWWNRFRPKDTTLSLQWPSSPLSPFTSSSLPTRDSYSASCPCAQSSSLVSFRRTWTRTVKLKSKRSTYSRMACRSRLPTCSVRQSNTRFAHCARPATRRSSLFISSLEKALLNVCRRSSLSSSIALEADLEFLISCGLITRHPRMTSTCFRRSSMGRRLRLQQTLQELISWDSKMTKSTYEWLKFV